MCLELGGNDAFIVLDDADLDLSVNTAVLSRLTNSGQACINAKRFIVDAKIYDQFLDKLKRKLDKLVIGDPKQENTFVGPLAFKDQVLRLNNQLEWALKEGAVKTYEKETQHESFAPIVILESIPKNSTAY